MDFRPIFWEEAESWVKKVTNESVCQIYEPAAQIDKNYNILVWKILKNGFRTFLEQRYQESPLPDGYSNFDTRRTNKKEIVKFANEQISIIVIASSELSLTNNVHIWEYVYVNNNMDEFQS